MYRIMSFAFAVVVVSFFTCVHGASAQQSPLCDWTVQAWDYTCGNQVCNSTEGCTRQTFSPTCAGPYSMDVHLDCSSCNKCQSCASVYEIVGGSETLVTRHVTDCTHAQTCNGTWSISLTAGHSYAAYVCLQPCDNTLGYTCDDCPGCAAWVCIRKSTTPPCTPLK